MRVALWFCSNATEHWDDEQTFIRANLLTSRRGFGEKELYNNRRNQKWLLNIYRPESSTKEIKVARLAVGTTQRTIQVIGLILTTESPVTKMDARIKT